MPSGVTGTAATLNGVVNPAGVAVKECEFEYGETEAYGHTAKCEGAVPVDSSDHPVHATVVVAPGKTYHYRLVAANANDVNEPAAGGDVVFGPPLVDSEWSTAVTAGSAMLHAQVSTQNLETGVQVEYGDERGIWAARRAGRAGGRRRGAGSLFRADGPFAGERVSLPVCRGKRDGAGAGGWRGSCVHDAGRGHVPPGGLREWEMVSPVDRHGSSPEPPDSRVESGEGVTQAAASGGALSYLSDAPIESGPAGYGEFDQVYAVRGEHGWSSRDLGIAHAGTTNLSDEGREYKFFSEDLSAAVVHQYGSFLALSPWASEQTPYLNNPVSGVFTPLVTGCPSVAVEEEGHPCPPAVAEHADVPQGTVFGGSECPPSPQCGPRFVAATPDGTHVVLSSQVGLLEGHAGSGLYEWSGGALTFLTSGTLGTPVRTNEGVGAARHAISNDGSRVVFSKEHHLYLLDLAAGKTVPLDAPEACAPADECGKGNPSPYFQGASSDDSRVFFTRQPETDGAGGLR